MNLRTKLGLRAPRRRPLRAGMVFQRDAMGFRLKCTAAAARPDRFTEFALALRRPGSRNR